MTAVGVGMLFRAGRQRDAAWSGRTFVGSLIMGWGVFNLVEGLIAHYLLHIHHLVERMGLSLWDHAYLASGALLIAIGLGIIGLPRRDRVFLPSTAPSA